MAFLKAGRSAHALRARNKRHPFEGTRSVLKNWTDSRSGSYREGFGRCAQAQQRVMPGYEKNPPRVYDVDVIIIQAFEKLARI